jgi:hypothetical protein
LNLSGALGWVGWASGLRLRLGSDGARSFLSSGFTSVSSNGTMCAPVPLVSVRNTQAFAIVSFILEASGRDILWPVSSTADERVSDQLERWFREPGARTLGSLAELFEEKAFAVIFIVLMAVPALPLPTGGVTHVLEVVTMLLALELIVGRRTIWLPVRWQRLEVGGASRGRFVSPLLRRIRWAERYSHPRLRLLFGHRLTGVIFGLLVFALALTAFLAPPFSGLDTLPALGVVVLALGVLLQDFVLAVVGLIIGALGVVLVVTLGSLVLRLLGQLF